MGESSVHSADTLGTKNFIEMALSHTVFEINVLFALYAEIKDGHQKWRENDFGGKLAVNFSDTLEVKNLAEIALSCTVFEINVFLHFMQQFKMATKNGWKIIFGKSHQNTL